VPPQNHCLHIVYIASLTAREVDFKEIPSQGKCCVESTEEIINHESAKYEASSRRGYQQKRTILKNLIKHCTGVESADSGLSNIERATINRKWTRGLRERHEIHNIVTTLL